jgi:hypothetical protein
MSPNSVSAIEQRDEISYLRGPYNIEFYKRHNEAFRISAAFHYAHGRQHDVLQLTPFPTAPSRIGSLTTIM